MKIRVKSNDYKVVFALNNTSAASSSQSKYPGLYTLGEAVEGVGNIRNLSGKITITKVGED